MRNLPLIFALAVAPLCGEGWEEADRDRLISNLEQTRKNYTQALENVSEAQWKFKPAPERWSIAECAEHIAVTEPMLLGMVQKTLAGQPTAEFKGNAGSDAKIANAMTDRSKKFTAPKEVAPTGRFATKAETIAAFNKHRDVTIDLVKTTKLDLRSYGAKGPAGPMDASQWLLLISGHTDRHIAQMKEVMAHPDYPNLGGISNRPPQ